MNGIIYSYTRYQALADGILLRLEDFLDRQALEGDLIVAALRHSPSTRFALGELVITCVAAAELSSDRVLQSLIRHCQGDWGELPRSDRLTNESGLSGGDKLFSAYAYDDSPKFYIITEWNREATTVLLPEDN